MVTQSNKTINCLIYDGRCNNIKAFGYQYDSENLIELQEVTFMLDKIELEKIIKFLQQVKEEHSKINNETEYCHSHYRDWDTEWKDETADFIIVTTSKSE